MKKIISTLFISTAIACTPVSEKEDLNNNYLDYMLERSKISNCSSGLEEFKMGLDYTIQKNLDMAILHYQTAHELCPHNEIFRNFYKGFNKFLNNKIRYKI